MILAHLCGLVRPHCSVSGLELDVESRSPYPEALFVALFYFIFWAYRLKVLGH